MVPQDGRATRPSQPDSGNYISILVYPGSYVIENHPPCCFHQTNPLVLFQESSERELIAICDSLMGVKEREMKDEGGES